MRGGKSFSPRGGNHHRNGNFRQQGNRGGNSSSGGRYNNSKYNNNRYGNSSRDDNRSRYDRNSSNDRFSQNRRTDGHSSYKRHDSRGRADSPANKRSRYDAGGSRRDFNHTNSSDYSSHRHSNRDSSSSHRRTSGARHSSPSPSHRHNSRSNDKGTNERMGPPNRPPQKKFRSTAIKMSGGNNGRDSNRIRKTKMTSAVRSVALRRRVALRQRDTARRVKLARLARSTLKKNDASNGSPKSGTEDADQSDKKSVDNENDDENEKKKSKKTKTDETIGESDGEKNEEGGAEHEKSAKEGNSEKGDGKDDQEKDAKKSHDDKRSRDGKRRFIKLVCVHCHTKCFKFQDYQSHLFSRKHKNEMRQIAARQKAQINRMRLAQRKSQRELEETIPDAKDKPVQYCLMCRLNYRTSKEDHQASEAHIKMKKFLAPYCKICRLSFKSPMTYETHRASLEHLKRKASHKTEEGAEEDDKGLLDDIVDDELQVDLDHFMTVDSVGDVDGLHFSGNESDENGESEAGKSDINVGNEHVKKIEVFYCDLCRFYLPHLEDPEAALQKHCSTRNHLRAYLRFKENQSLKQAAELIHRRDHGDKSDAKDNGSETAANDEAANEDSKEWADIVKDELGDDDAAIENNQEDEDEDSRAGNERYDRFKNSGKSDDAEGGDLKKEINNGQEIVSIASEI